MRRLGKTQTGFGAIEVLLLIVAAALIGFLGYYTYHVRHTSNSPTANSAIKKAAPSTSIPSTDKATLKVPELGIKLINIPSSIQGLTYKVYPAGADQSYAEVTFSTMALTDQEAKCSADSSSGIGTLDKHSGVYDAHTHHDPSVFVKQFDGFWIAFVRSEIPCSQTKATLDLQSSQIDAFRRFATTPANVQLAQ